MRKPLDIDRLCLEQIITKLETTKTYPNRSKLYEDVSSEYYSARSVKLSTATIYLRVKEWGLTLQTPVGKKGRQAGQKISRTPKKGNIAYLRKEWEKDKDAKPFMKILDRVEKGSLKAAIKANCLACGNFQRAEIKECQVFSCPLWSVRPYK